MTAVTAVTAVVIVLVVVVAIADHVHDRHAVVHAGQRTPSVMTSPVQLYDTYRNPSGSCSRKSPVFSSAFGLTGP